MTRDDLTADQPGALVSVIRQHFDTRPPARLGVAVSGGSDSVGVLIALNDWRLTGGPDLQVVTVDHGLRPEAAEEAAEVARLCAGLGLRHEVLRWQGWDGRGNLPDAARRARYRLMADWARRQGLADLVLGHTRDDLAETFVLRLMRGAGISGLSAMAARRDLGGLTLHRPALAVQRTAWQRLLRERNIAWVDDPSNTDPAYDRVRVRQILQHIGPLGLTTDALAGAAARIADGDRALAHVTSEVGPRVLTVVGGDVLISPEALAAQPHEIARRLIRRVLLWISGEGYSPRGAALDRVLAAIGAGETTTLQGVLFYKSPRCDHPGLIRATRELRAVIDCRVIPPGCWDRRWQVMRPARPATQCRALGPAGWQQIRARAGNAPPYQSVIAMPALWEGDEVISVPFTQIGDPRDWTLIPGKESLFEA